MYAALFGTPTGAPSRSDNFYAAPRAPTADSTELDLEAHSCELDWSPAAGGGAATDGAAKSPGVVVVAGAATKSEAMSRPTPDGHRAATTSDQRYERARRPVHTDDSAWRAADGYRGRRRTLSLPRAARPSPSLWRSERRLAGTPRPRATRRP